MKIHVTMSVAIVMYFVLFFYSYGIVYLFLMQNNYTIRSPY